MISWSALILGYARLEHESEAKEVFEDMEDKWIEPNVVCCNGMINLSGCYSESMLTFRKIHS
ncbi:hypothetical protein RHMOL_Rhmol09G0009400 [Rhododendron molle]|nr:hypothetical protein RHMOL_Rhmol09G0009400 [Rhododendron molle]